MAVKPVEDPHQASHLSGYFIEFGARPHVGSAAGLARLDGFLELAHFPLEIGQGKLGKPHAEEELPFRFS